MKISGSFYATCVFRCHQRKANLQQNGATILRRTFSVLLVCAMLLQGSADAQLMSPEDTLGFQVGADYQVAAWQTVSDYMRHVAANSDRVVLDVLGKTTEGNDFVILLISAPENLENLGRYQQIQKQLALPNTVYNRGQQRRIGRACRRGESGRTD